MRLFRRTAWFSMLASLLTLMLFAMPTRAGASGDTGVSLVIDNLRYDLTDLDPADGITPTLTFTIDPTVRWSNTRVDAYGHFGLIARDYTVPQPAATPSMASLDYPSWRASAALAGTVPSGLFLQGSASISSHDGSELQISTRADSGYLSFMLSPMSALILRSDIALHASTSMPSAPAVGGSARVQASMTVYPGLPSDLDTLRAFQRLDTVAGECLDYQGTLGLTVSNASTAALDGTLVLNGSGIITGAVAAVPEPASWALLLAGCALVCLRGRYGLKRPGGQPRPRS